MWGRNGVAGYIFQSRAGKWQPVKHFLPWASGLRRVEEGHRLADPAIFHPVSSCLVACPSRAVTVQQSPESASTIDLSTSLTQTVDGAQPGIKVLCS